MTAEGIGLALQAINALALPVMIGLGRYLWRVERRLMMVELKLGVDPQL